MLSYRKSRVEEQNLPPPACVPNAGGTRDFGLDVNKMMTNRESHVRASLARPYRMTVWRLHLFKHC